jgi:hypothetical protein
VDEHVLTAAILLDETEAFVRVEELYGAGAFADDLGGHSAATAAARTTATTAETAAARSAIATAAAKAATVTTAKTSAIAAESPTVATEPVAATKAITAARKRIETFLAETVPLVTATAATSSIKTHRTEFTFASPHSTPSGGADESHRTTGQTADRPSPL